VIEWLACRGSVRHRIPGNYVTVSTEIHLYALLAERLDDPLDGYERYSVPNWNGDHAEPITAETISGARRFIQLLPDALSDPHIAPGADGTIGFYWTTPAYQLSVDVGPSTTWRAYWRILRDDTFRSTGRRKIDGSTTEMLLSIFEPLLNS
jgi:hypothetical protein